MGSDTLLLTGLSRGSVLTGKLGVKHTLKRERPVSGSAPGALGHALSTAHLTPAARGPPLPSPQQETRGSLSEYIQLKVLWTWGALGRVDSSIRLKMKGLSDNSNLNFRTPAWGILLPDTCSQAETVLGRRAGNIPVPCYHHHCHNHHHRHHHHLLGPFSART